jgi:hypothetical protein
MKHLQNCSESPSPPDAVGMKSGFASQFAVHRPVNHLQNKSIEDVPPQLKLIVVLELQYAALAKNVKGVNDEICVELRAVMLCLLEGWTRFNPGAALTIDASSKGRMKPTNSILQVWDGCQKLGIHWQKTVCILAFAGV